MRKELKEATDSKLAAQTMLDEERQLHDTSIFIIEETRRSRAEVQQELDNARQELDLHERHPVTSISVEGGKTVINLRNGKSLRTDATRVEFGQ